MPPSTRVLVIDSDDYSASVLLDDLRRHGYTACERVAQGLAVPAAVTRVQPDVVLFNYHFDHPDDLLSCCTAKLTAPDAAVVAIAATGPAVRAVRKWAGETGYIDAVLQKPLAAGDLLATLGELVRSRAATKALREQTERMANLLPAGALSALEQSRTGQEELFEAAVLFTDIRRSSDLITRSGPREFFQLLNGTLSAQADRIRSFDGEIVKYTGDGLMAVFRGMGRSYLALRCAFDLAAASQPDDPLPYGIGVAEGLVLAGLVGASGPDKTRRSQYDVIGATVHLAARLCALAGAGEVLTTQGTYAASRLEAPLRSVGAVTVRGFPAAIDCVAFDPRAALQPA